MPRKKPSEEEQLAQSAKVLGRRGGRRTAARLGVEHYQRIGKKSAEARAKAKGVVTLKFPDGNDPEGCIC